jgi:DNA-binding CsgD family transcriptional regulator
LLTDQLAAPFQQRENEHRRRVEAAARRQRIQLIIVDSDCRVVVDSIESDELVLQSLLSGDRTMLHDTVSEIVRPLIERCLGGEPQAQIAFLDAHHYVRVTQLEGRQGTLFAVTVEYFRGGDSLTRAARKYRLTPREIDVLALILEGASAGETARTLKIAETTVQGYYKRLLSKTQSRNRPAMVANVLDWQPAP